MRYFVIPYKRGSKSARALSEGLGGCLMRLEGSRYRPRQDDVLINWGNGTWTPPEGSPVVLNHSFSLPPVTDKKRFFELIDDHDLNDLVPKFWFAKDDVPNDAFPVVCRTVLNGHSGAGIVVAYSREQLVDCSLYVQYIKKKDEYRVHLGRTKEGIRIISAQRKARSLQKPASEIDWRIRNHAGGFVYVREGVILPSDAEATAARAVEAASLDFGAVDLIYNEKRDRSYVLEINTAPGLEGQTVDDYVTFFKGLQP